MAHLDASLHPKDLQIKGKICRTPPYLGVKIQKNCRGFTPQTTPSLPDQDPFAKMAYSYCPVGTAPLRAELAASCGARHQLLFAGEATHPTKASFAHGALEEGERAAMEVLRGLTVFRS